MKTVAYKLLDKLNPVFKKKVDWFMAEVNKNWKVIFITESWRSEERQKELLSLWLSKVKHSKHQDWLAIDIAFYWIELYPADISKWNKVYAIAKKYWINSWFIMWKWDKPHLEL